MKALKKAFPVILVTVVVFIATVSLAFTDAGTRDMIEYQRERRFLAMLEEIFPDLTRFTENDIYTIYIDEAEVGHAFRAVGRGFAGPIVILVGLEDAITIRGIAIISHRETPGLGGRVAEPDFTDQFAGLYVGDVALRRDGGKIDAITGATISARAVADAVRATAEEKARGSEGER